MKKNTADFESKPLSHMISASMGEIMACTVRVPGEVIKQRTQAGTHGLNTSLQNFKYLISNQSGEGVFRGLYRGWNSTILREIPFTIIQFPLYEYFKTIVPVNNESLLAGALCGSVAGGIAAALTTPLDVVKTRIMLNPGRVSALVLIKEIVREEGYSAFLRGIGPRTCWISAGGAIFLGCYEMVHGKLAMV